MLHRLLDANANRAREALRVLEDAARFALSDAALSAALKSERHDLRAALDAAGLDPLLLARHRDTGGDVGTAISTPAEMTREGLPDIAAAAAARLGEALRCIEEAVKALPGAAEPARRVEQIRYRTYTLGARVVSALGTGRAVQWALCVIVTEALCALPWETVAEQAVEGGATCVQLREKSLSDAELLRRARRLVEVARPNRAVAIINDRPDIALLAGAGGVHLGPDDLSIGDARALAGGRLLVGASASTLDEARAAAGAGADYLGLGSMFPTATKHKPFVSGLDHLRACLGDPLVAGRPHLAIGGITPDNAGELRLAGCRGIAVSSCVCRSDRPREVCESLARTITARTGAGQPA